MATATPSRKRAITATIIFSAFGLAVMFLFPLHWNTAWPLVLFYAIMVWNTYYSVDYFSRVIPINPPLQVLVDSVLFLLYFLAALSFLNTYLFILTLGLIFAVATVKYALALNVVEHPRKLFRKIVVDTMGMLMVTCALIGAALGYDRITAIALVVVFGIANIYVIYIKPLYTD